MKYLRVFEGFGDDYYVEISEDDWREWEDKLLEYNDDRSRKPFIDFRLKEFLMLRSRSVNNEGLFRSKWILTNNKEHSMRSIDTIAHIGFQTNGVFNKSHSGIMWVINVLVDNADPGFHTTTLPHIAAPGISLSVSERKRFWNLTVWMIDDEWYMVKIQNKSYKPFQQEQMYYKCDQFDGLVKLLLDYGFIK